MRTIGVGLLAFLLAGIALLISSLDLWDRGWRYVDELTSGPQLVFEDRRLGDAADDYRAVIYRSGPDNSILLSGFPAYQGATFTMPVDARPVTGYLQIDATVQVLDGVEGLLRISIDNVRRGELLLRPGEVSRSMQIQLSPTELARERIYVTFSLQGHGPNSECSIEAGREVVVEIEATSAIYAAIDRPLISARDLVNSWGGVVRIAWPQEQDDDQRLQRFLLATELRRRSVEIFLVSDTSSDAFNTSDVRQVLADAASLREAQIDESWPRSIASSGANFGVRRFHRSTSWRERYDLRRGDPVMMPEQLDLHLVLGPQGSGARWSVLVTLNGRLLDQQMLGPDETGLETLVDLPGDLQSTINTVEVTVWSDFDRQDGCNTSPLLVAEMLPETRLLAGSRPYSDALTDLRHRLSEIQALDIGTVSNLGSVDATAAADLISALVPGHVYVTPGFDAAHAVIIPPGTSADTLAPTETSWIVYRDATTRELVVEPYSPQSGAHLSAMAVLVSMSRIRIPGAST